MSQRGIELNLKVCQKICPSPLFSFENRHPDCSNKDREDQPRARFAIVMILFLELRMN